MKKKLDRGIFYFFSLVTSIAIGLYSLNSPILTSATLSAKYVPQYTSKDSAIVSKLNEKAFKSRLTNPTQTIQTADSALRLAKKVGYLPGAAEAYRIKGIGFHYGSNLQNAVRNYLRALQLFKKLTDTVNEGKVYNNLGNLYRNNDFNKALVYFEQALALMRKVNNEEQMAGIYFNIATIYLQKSQYDKALSYYEMSNRILTARGNNTYDVIYLLNTGLVYSHLKKNIEAKNRLVTAIKKAKSRDLYESVIGGYLSLFYVYLAEKDLVSAQQAISEGIKYSRLLDSPKREHQFTYLAYELELERKNYRKALGYLKRTYSHDSILLSRNLSDNIDKTTQHYVQQQKINEAQLTISRQQYREATFRWFITLIILGFISFALVVMILHLIKEKRVKKKEVITQNNITSLEQKALQAMMNPHFVFNIMNSIQYFVNQSDARIANQILTEFSNLTRRHLEICLSNQISLEEEILYLESYLSLEKVRVSAKMDYEIHIAKDVDTEDIYIPSLLIQPFIENAIWHGIMPKKKGGFIKLSVSIKNDTLLISIFDNGVGIKNTEGTKKNGHVSRGMSMIWERVSLLNQLNKRHILINQYQTGDSGTHVLIQIPA